MTEAQPSSPPAIGPARMSMQSQTMTLAMCCCITVLTFTANFYLDGEIIWASDRGG